MLIREYTIASASRMSYLKGKSPRIRKAMALRENIAYFTLDVSCAP